MGGIMLDSVNPAAVLDAIKARRTWRNMAIKAGAGYVDGPNSAWPSGAFTALRATGVTVVEITVLGAQAADVADIETGDLTPAKGAEWASGEVKAGRVPGLYVNRSNKPVTEQECSSRGLKAGKDFVWWVATLDGSFTDTNGADLRQETGVVAVQFADAARLGIDADASVITTFGNSWFHLEPTWEEQALTQAEDLTALIKAHQ
jgi:hypothetical protein